MAEHNEFESKLANKEYEGINYQARLVKKYEFYKDMINFLDLKDTEISERLFAVAWEEKHSYGYQEVYWFFKEIVDGFEKFLNSYRYWSE